MTKQICAECGELFYTVNRNKVICSKLCENKRYQRKVKEAKRKRKTNPTVYTCSWCGKATYNPEGHEVCLYQKAGLLKTIAWNPGKIEPVKHKFNLRHKRSGLWLENSWYGELMLGTEANPNPDKELLW